MAAACFIGSGALAQAQVGPLEQLRSQSEQAEALIRQGDTSAKTQQVQQGIVHGLDTLIAAFAAQEGVSVPVPGKQLVPTRLQQPGAGTEAWMLPLPPNERKAISDAFRTGRLPPPYEEFLRE